MPTLKVYCIGNLDGRHSAIVVAPNKAAACEAMHIKGAGKSEVATAVPIAHADDEAWSLAMATPGIPWKRSICTGPDGTRDWHCADPAAGARAIVRGRFPEAVSFCMRESGWAGPPLFVVWPRIDEEQSLGGGPTEDDAWIEAARILMLDVPGLPDNAIVVWRHEDAPECFRALEPDDVDWVAWVPAKFAGDYVDFLEAGPFARCGEPKRFPVRRGEVRIATH